MNTVVKVLTQDIINPLLLLIFAAGLLVFAFGIVEFLFDLNRGEGEGKEKGKEHILWGLIGMFIIASAYTIVQLIGNTVSNPLPSL